MKKIIRTIVLMLLIPIGLVVYYWATYIDDTTTRGNAYGFKIGESKHETYKKLPGNLRVLEENGGKVFFEIKSTLQTSETLAVMPGFTVMVEAILHDIGFPYFKSQNAWRFYVSGSYFNTLELKFCDDKLCEIYRHRKYFEAP